MEQPHQFTAYGVNACQIRSLSEVTAMTRQGKVLVTIGPTVLLRNYVLDVVRQVAIFLR
jgi:hypothetical protein